jgi:hypothetical protein
VSKQPWTVAHFKLARMSVTRPFGTLCRPPGTSGLKTGFRISELLSLKVKDVWKDGQVGKVVSVARKSMKGKQSARSLPLNEGARKASGHKNINSTVSYLGFGTDAEISEAILSLQSSGGRALILGRCGAV